jgi:outer membrane murein-binding lipoprotein Lpp
VVFATSDFQVTTDHGIQGISAGEAVNFIRQSGGDYVVEYAGFEFKKNKSYFASTYVKPAVAQATPAPEPSAPEQSVPPNEALGDPPLPGEPPLGSGTPSRQVSLLAEDKKVGSLTDSIRALNDQIRAAQEDLERMSARAKKGGGASEAEIKKASRTIQRLKAKRDALSGELTEVGKP